MPSYTRILLTGASGFVGPPIGACIIASRLSHSLPRSYRAQPIGYVSRLDNVLQPSTLADAQAINEAVSLLAA